MILPELIHASWGSSTHSALTWMGSRLKTDTVLNDETSEIERDLRAFGPIWGGVSQLLSNSSDIIIRAVFANWTNVIEINVNL